MISRGRHTVDRVAELFQQARHSDSRRAVQLCRSLAQQQGVAHDT